MKIAILAGVLALSGCAAIDRTLTKYEDWPHSLMPESIRSDVARFDPHDYDAWWPESTISGGHTDKLPNGCNPKAVAVTAKMRALGLPAKTLCTAAIDGTAHNYSVYWAESRLMVYDPNIGTRIFADKRTKALEVADLVESGAVGAWWLEEFPAR